MRERSINEDMKTEDKDYNTSYNARLEKKVIRSEL